jgi:hypothetical protein
MFGRNARAEITENIGSSRATQIRSNSVGPSLLEKSGEIAAVKGGQHFFLVISAQRNDGSCLSYLE